MLFSLLCWFLGITELEVEPYDEDLGTGELRYVQVSDDMQVHNSFLLFPNVLQLNWCVLHADGCYNT